MTEPTAPLSTPALAPRELDLFSFVIMLLRHTRFIIGCAVVGFLLMLGFMLRTKPRFASTAVMIVPQANITSSMMAMQLTMSTNDLLGGGYELYGDIIKSRIVADRLIQRFHLMEAYNTKELAIAEIVLAKLTKVETQREGLIRVTVQDTDPKRAADLANAYLEQLDAMNSQLVLTSAGQERAFLERELIREKEALADAEVALKEVSENTSGVSPEAQAAAGLSALETARAQLRAAQIQLSALLTNETDQNPDVVRLRAQIAGLSGQVEQLERGSSNTFNGTPLLQLPKESLDYVRRKRDVTFHEALFELLAKQFEAAKQREAKTPTIVQVLDPAIPSLHKAWPPRTLYCLVGGIVGGILGVFFVSISAIIRAYMRNPANALKLAQLRALWRFRQA